MTEFWTHFSFGAIIVCLTGLAFSTGFILKTIKLMLEAQRFILDHQLAMARAIAQGSLSHQMMATNNWRELPPDGRLILRNALVEVLAEMDREMAPAGQREAPTRH